MGFELIFAEERISLFEGEREEESECKVCSLSRDFVVVCVCCELFILFSVKEMFSNFQMFCLKNSNQLCSLQ